MRLVVPSFLILTFTVYGLSAAPDVPKSVTIVPVPGHSLPDGTPGGNVKVTFSSNRAEVWTTRGHCLLPRVSQGGLVGWTHASGRHSRGMWMNKALRIARDGRLVREFKASRAFIEVWDLTDSDSCVIIRSRNAHGPSRIEKFRIDTGELVAEGSGSHDVPAWAQPYSDDVSQSW